jgi:hypothetical protein
LISHLLQGAPQQARLSIFANNLGTHIGSNSKYLAPTSFSFSVLERICIERNRTLCGHHRAFLHYPPYHLPNYKRLSATHYIPKKILPATARRESVPESGRPVTRKTRVKTDDPMRATEGGETQAAAAAAATSTTEATEEEEEEEEEAATPLIIICSVPSRYYYYTHHHHHHNRRARDFLVSQFRCLLPMRAKHGKQPI